MDKRMHAAGQRSRMRRTFTAAGRRAGMPVKRFFTRFSSLSHVPAEDLDFLSERIRLGMVTGQESDTAQLYAAVREEIRNRKSASNE